MPREGPDENQLFFRVVVFAPRSSILVLLAKALNQGVLQGLAIIDLGLRSRQAHVANFSLQRRAFVRNSTSPADVATCKTAVGIASTVRTVRPYDAEAALEFARLPILAKNPGASRLEKNDGHSVDFGG